MVLLSMGARVVSEQEDHTSTRPLPGSARLPGFPTEACNREQPHPNAFATGRNTKNSVVAVTTGFAPPSTRRRFEAVLAHELSHVKNRDVMVMTLARPDIYYCILSSSGIPSQQAGSHREEVEGRISGSLSGVCSGRLGHQFPAD